MIADKCIVIGITGGIAAYKVADLVSRLVKAGADVHTIMTDSATEFITPLTLQTISRNPVITKMFELPHSWQVQHVTLADRADLMVVIPATANIVGKVRAGIADDMLSTTIMATRAPVLFVPAMNVHMYENPIVQANIQSLRGIGYHFMEPATGPLACGYEGKGRMPEVEAIFKRICGFWAFPHDLAGKMVLVTAGPTREYVDPVRFISNGSTGKMGYALAEAAAERGARVILVSGPVNLPAPEGVEYCPVTSADDMFAAVERRYREVDVVIKTAAVADYSPEVTATSKIKKGDGGMTIQLTRTPDILKYLGENKGKRILVGFAAETDDLLINAAKKVQAKNLDFIVANDITQPGAGFGTDTNIVKLVFRDGRVEELAKMPKKDVAHRILDRVSTMTINKGGI